MVGIRFEGSQNTLTNAGIITGAAAEGIRLEDDNSEIVNTGEISGGTDGIRAPGEGGSATASVRGNHQIANDGVISAGRGHGIEGFGTENVLSNTGTISAPLSAMVITGSGVIANSGSVSSFGTGRALVIRTNERPGEIHNSGTILSDTGRGILITSDGSTVFNTGDITTADTGIWADGDDMRVTNTGTITSDDEGIFVSEAGTIVNEGVINVELLGLCMGASDSAASVIENSGTDVASESFAVLLTAPSIGGRALQHRPDRSGGIDRVPHQPRRQRSPRHQ